ncbi:hypothetical protein [Candidatus Albibeggiatoa sp. nov. NOAA]|uniref:J domain-containing protein n=1 Tax=Candidatus Albibeggiatoa sp. nov. NOAA TaxID=3162724 RepID=UPI003301667E|nr:hypothetical protein [Thiotrichaceae bacterium]
MKNYYQILGISPDTDQSEIKAAAQAKANEINEAFRILNDPEQRSTYDQTLKAELEPPVPQTQTSRSATPPKFKVAGENRKRFTNMLSSWGEYLHLETPSARDVTIFMVALVFFVYMLGQFLFPPPLTPPSQPALSLGTYSSSTNQN